MWLDAEACARPARPTRTDRWLCRLRFGPCFGLGLARFAADTRQISGEKAGGDIDFAAFYILPVPSSLSAKWRRVKIGSLPSFSRALAFASGWLVQLHEPPTSGGYVASHATETHPPRLRPSAQCGSTLRNPRSGLAVEIARSKWLDVAPKGTDYRSHPTTPAQFDIAADSSAVRTARCT